MYQADQLQQDLWMNGCVDISSIYTSKQGDQVPTARTCYKPMTCTQGLLTHNVPLPIPTTTHTHNAWVWVYWGTGTGSYENTHGLPIVITIGLGSSEGVSAPSMDQRMEGRRFWVCLSWEMGRAQLQLKGVAPCL